jgi:hypothetical protein
VDPLVWHPSEEPNKAKEVCAQEKKYIKEMAGWDNAHHSTHSPHLPNSPLPLLLFLYKLLSLKMPSAPINTMVSDADYQEDVEMEITPTSSKTTARAPKRKRTGVVEDEKTPSKVVKTGGNRSVSMAAEKMKDLQLVSVKTCLLFWNFAEMMNSVRRCLGVGELLPLISWSPRTG